MRLGAVLRTTATLVLLVLSVQACGEDTPSGPTAPPGPPDPPDPPGPAPVAMLIVSPDSADVTKGLTRSFAATAYDSAGNVLDGRALAWSSDDALVATVSSDGMVTGVDVGTARIAATSEGVTGSATVEVKAGEPAPVATVELSPDSALLETDSALVLVAELRDSAGVLLDRPVIWSSLDAAIANVDSGGMVTGIAPGSAHIIAAAEGLADTAWIDVVHAAQVLVGAGDISDCETAKDEETATLLDQIEGTVFAAGDLVYEEATTEDFADCYDPTWGRHRDRTYPAIGNHEYKTDAGAPYFAYFGSRAGNPAEGWYSYELGAWKIYVLNSNKTKVDVTEASAQVQWLRAELAADTGRCTMAIWHHPRFSSGLYGNDASFQPFWSALHEYGAEVVLVGHEHHYERLAPMDAAGASDPGAGVRQFIVGTGGRPLRPTLIPLATSEVRNSIANGVIKFTLKHDSYDWEFVPIAGQTFTDSGSTPCH